MATRLVDLDEESEKILVQLAEGYGGDVDQALSNLIRTYGLERRADRKAEFLAKLEANLKNQESGQQDQAVDQFRDLILGH